MAAEPEWEGALGRAQGLLSDFRKGQAALKTSITDARQQQQAELIGQLRPGDVIFYATDTATAFLGLDDAKFGDFDVLAAFVQAFPYTLAGADPWSSQPSDFKPWHHTAIVIDGEGPTAVGFDAPIWQGAGSGPLDTHPVDPVPSQRISALRPSSARIGQAIATKAERQLGEGISYSKKGLLAFTTASEARMRPAGQLRETQLDRAHGLHVLAREADPSKHSCVTAAACAVAPSVPLSFPEPPTPGKAAFAVAMSSGAMKSSVLAAYKKMNDDLVALGSGSIAAAITNGDAGLLTPEGISGLGGHLGFTVPDERLDEIIDRYLSVMDLAAGSDTLPPLWPGGPYDGQLVADSHTVLFGLSETSSGVTGTTTDAELIAKGKQDRLSPVTEDHLIVSPAMFWDALAGPGGAGFTQII